MPRFPYYCPFLLKCIIIGIVIVIVQFYKDIDSENNKNKVDNKNISRLECSKHKKRKVLRVISLKKIFKFYLDFINSSLIMIHLQSNETNAKRRGI